MSDFSIPDLWPFWVLIVLVIFILVMIVLRPVYLWYTKNKEIVELLREINRKLSEPEKKKFADLNKD